MLSFFRLVIVFVVPLSFLLASTASSMLTPLEAFENGKELFFKKKYQAAETLFQYCVDQVPASPEYRCWLAQAIAMDLGERVLCGASPVSLLNAGRKIHRLYKEALDINPEHQRARIGYALILRDTPSWLGGNDSRAEQILKEIVAQTPDHIFALHYLGTFYIRNRGEYRLGLEYLERAADVQQYRDLNREEFFMMANTYHAMGAVYLNNLFRLSQAVYYFEKSLAIDPASPQVLLDLTRAYQQSGRTAEAARSFQQATELIETKKYRGLYEELAALAEYF